MKLIQDSERRYYYFKGDSKSQIAVVVFEKTSGCIWKFLHCKFRTNKDIYTELDWEFLGAINEQIEKIHKSLIK